VAVFIDLLQVNSMNQAWKGAAASLTSRAALPDRKRIGVEFLSSWLDRNRIRIADAIDWMIKYFIGNSAFLFFIERILQNARVFISRAIQRMNHEFLVRQIKEVKTRVR
jgi:hypothetical protein